MAKSESLPASPSTSRMTRLLAAPQHESVKQNVFLPEPRRAVSLNFPPAATSPRSTLTLSLPAPVLRLTTSLLRRRELSGGPGRIDGRSVVDGPDPASQYWTTLAVLIET